MMTFIWATLPFGMCCGLIKEAQNAKFQTSKLNGLSWPAFFRSGRSHYEAENQFLKITPCDTSKEASWDKESNHVSLAYASESKNWRKTLKTVKKWPFHRNRANFHVFGFFLQLLLSKAYVYHTWLDSLSQDASFEVSQGVIFKNWFLAS